jgi:hypothetical protein
MAGYACPKVAAHLGRRNVTDAEVGVRLRPGAPPRRSAARLGAIEVALAAAIGLSVLVVHDVPYLLSHSFWVDEAWVADSVRAPARLVPSLASTTPLGWMFLLRLVPFGGAQRLRLVPLAFAMLTAVAGYVFGRELRLTRFATATLTGVAALLSPAMLARDDLKQYTAEAFACLVVWVLVARIENQWSMRRLVAIAATASLGMLFAETVIIVGVAAMGGLGLECLITRRYRRLGGVAAASAGMLAVSLVIFETLIRARLTPALSAIWDPSWMPTQSASAALNFLHLRLDYLAPYMGFGSLAVDAAGALAGIAALIWLRRYALAAMFPVMLVILVVASADRAYPFGDLRTSTFWLVLVPVLMAVAVAAAGKLAGTLDRRLPLAVAAVALAVWVPATDGYIRSQLIPDEDVHSEVAYLDAHFRRGDVVIVNYGASYGFAYYFGPQPSFPAGVGANGHEVSYPGRPWIVVAAPGRPTVAIPDALAKARAEIAREPAGARGRIWIVRSHQSPAEVVAWRRGLARDRITVIRVGPDPIVVYTPS